MKKQEIVVPNLVPPVGGYIIYPLTVQVRYDQDWQKALTHAGPLTSPCRSSSAKKWEGYVRDIGNLWPPTPTSVKKVELILISNYTGNGDWSTACLWAHQFGLKKTVPREVFAIGENHPDLDEIILVDKLEIYAATDFSFQGYKRNICRICWARPDYLSPSYRWVDCSTHMHLTLREKTEWIAFRK